MWTALDIFIGLTLCYALVSLICTVIQEFIAQMLNSRGKLLQRQLRRSFDATIVQALKSTSMANDRSIFGLPRIEDILRWIGKLVTPLLTSFGPTQNLATGAGQALMPVVGARIPHDFKSVNMAKTLVSALGLIANGAATLPDDAAIRALPIPEGLKSHLLALSSDARNSVHMITGAVEAWCDDFSGQLEHWFARKAQVVSLIIGAIAALALNVDTIAIAERLRADPVARAAAVALAEKVNADQTVAGCPPADGKPKEVTDATIRACAQAVIANYPVGLGWGKDVTEAGAGKNWFCRILAVISALLGQLGDISKLAGIAISALALSLGARFWFDTLKGLLALRTGGQARQNQG